MSRLPVALVLALALAAALFAWPAPTAAHALLVRSDPADDARLVAAPPRVTAWFSESLERGVSSLRVLDGAGKQVDTGRTEFDPHAPTRMSVALRDGIGPGVYTVTWETLSRIDGHIRFGSFRFTVLTADGAAPIGPGLASEPPPTGGPGGIAENALAKAAGLIGAMIVIGGLAFFVLVARPTARPLADGAGVTARDAAVALLARLVVPAIALLAVAGGAELLLQARQLGGIGRIGTALRTTWGDRWLERQLVLALLAAAVAVYLLVQRRHARSAGVALWAALGAGLGYLLLVSAVSHAAAIMAGSFWATAADVIHLATAAVWIGGLVQLALLLRWSRRNLPDESRPPLLAGALQRFSLLASVSVVALLATGVFSALVHVSTPAALVDTAYGRVLMAKLVLALPLLVAGAINAVVLRPRLVRAASTMQDIERLRGRLSRLVAVEAAAALAVLLIVGLLVQYPTPRSAAGTTLQAQASAQGGDRFAYPLMAGAWGTVGGIALAVAGVLAWVWASQSPALRRGTKKGLRWAAITLPALGLALVLLTFNRVPADQRASPATPPAPDGTPPARAGQPPAMPGSPFTAAVALRYQTEAGQFVLLEIAPFQVGQNTFHVTVLDGDGRPAAADGVTLRFSQLEREGAAEVAAHPAPDGRFFVAESALAETGWWAIEVRLAGRPGASFYLRLDDPSRAPLGFAPPNYQSDPAAAALFRQTIERYEHLSSLRWREELTSGLLAPTGIGAWVLSTADAAAPDKVHIHVLSPGFSEYELYRIGGTTCSQPRGGAWQCSKGEGEEALDLDYLEPATAFRLGRREPIDGETTRVLLFYNPGQPAWYAWWVGEDTGYLRRQAMVAAGHVMLVRFFDHNAPISIELPPAARPAR